MSSARAAERGCNGCSVAPYRGELPVSTTASGTPPTPTCLFGAVQNLMLAARRYNVGSTLTMLHRRKEREVGRLLGLPDDARAIALIPLGYPRSGRFTVARRAPVEAETIGSGGACEASVRPVLRLAENLPHRRRSP
jgi:nitroreductase